MHIHHGIRLAGLAAAVLIGSIVCSKAEENKPSVDLAFVSELRAAGVVQACSDMGMDFDAVFLPLARRTDHQYRRYRWSVDSMRQIHAMPPEEETGWTPWERWSVRDGKPVHTEWVQYPVITPVKRNIIPWYALPESGDLTPRYLQKVADFEAYLRRARVDVAAEWLGLDFQKTFIEAVSQDVRVRYQQFRWVVIPHVLAADGPVIYALPPMHKSDEWPWLSYYTDGDTPQILHVHYTAQTSKTTGSWSEPAGAPQRPPEIYGYTWFWYNEPLLALPCIDEE